MKKALLLYENIPAGSLVRSREYEVDILQPGESVNYLAKFSAEDTLPTIILWLAVGRPPLSVLLTIHITTPGKAPLKSLSRVQILVISNAQKSRIVPVKIMGALFADELTAITGRRLNKMNGWISSFRVTCIILAKKIIHISFCKFSCDRNHGAAFKKNIT